MAVTTATRERWRLRPGTPVLRRDAATLQVGLDPAARVVLPDTPEVRRLLAQLETGTDLLDVDASASLARERLAAVGLLVLAGDAEGSLVGATAAWSGPGAADRVRARARLRVAVRGAPVLREPLVRLLEAGGTRVAAADPAHPADPADAGADAGAGAATDADLVVVLRDGEPRRDELDVLLASGVPHLPVWSRAGLPRVGPLVVPGVTACQRCVDAHDGEHDPRRALLLEQAAAQPGAARDPVLVAMALAWAARDVQRYAEGDEPATWSATVRIEAWGPPLLTRWPRHVHCGCAWDADQTDAGA